eukprot:3769677-Rhodomonas_salina.1
MARAGSESSRSSIHFTGIQGLLSSSHYPPPLVASVGSCTSGSVSFRQREGRPWLARLLLHRRSPSKRDS